MGWGQACSCAGWVPARINYLAQNAEVFVIMSWFEYYKFIELTIFYVSIHCNYYSSCSLFHLQLGEKLLKVDSWEFFLVTTLSLPLLSALTRCPWLISGISFPRPRCSHFSKEPWFLFVGCGVYMSWCGIQDCCYYWIHYF